MNPIQARVITVIEVTYLNGDGTLNNPKRLAAQYFDCSNGLLLAETEAVAQPTAERHFERLGKNSGASR